VTGDTAPDVASYAERYVRELKTAGAIRSPEGILWWKDGSLAGELDRLYRDWDARGRPGMVGYRLVFVPVERDSGPPPEGWVIERRFYRELVTPGD
jgi:hypothetical protein